MSGVVQVQDVVFDYDDDYTITFEHNNTKWTVQQAYLKNKSKAVLLQVEDDDDDENEKYYLVKVNNKKNLKRLKNELDQRNLIMKEVIKELEEMATWKKNGFRIALRL